MAKGDLENGVPEVVGRIPSGCCILTARDASRQTGMLLSWMQQASFQPLLLSMAIRMGRPILELLEASKACTLNLLGEEPREMLRHFGRGFQIDEAAFVGLACAEVQSGVVLKDAIGYLECSIESRLAAGDHWLYLVCPERGRLLQAGSPYVHLRKSALTY